MKPDIYQIIEARRQWHYQVSPEDEAKGFRGWHSRGYLPHFDTPGTQQFLHREQPGEGGLGEVT